MFECACSCGYDGEAPELFTQKTIKARAPHFCYECGEVINPGDYYEQVKGKWDGNFETYRTCGFCLKIRDMVCCDGYTFGELWPTVNECWEGAKEWIGIRMWSYEYSET